MNLVAAIVFAVIVVAIVGFAVLALRGASSNASSSTPQRQTTAPTRPLPIVTEFHVRGDTASVVFAVPLGDSEAGDHLIELLNAAAIEHVREKVDDGLPLDGVTKVAVSAMRGDTPEVLDTVHLPDTGELPDPAEILTRAPSDDDPIAALAAVTADASVAEPAPRTDRLESVAEFVALSGPQEAQLRAIGVDPASMTLSDLVVGLLRVSGYQVEIGRPGLSMSAADTGDVMWVSRNGVTSLVVIIRHEEGSYPELDDSALSEFAVAVAQANPSQGILVTDKFSPYSMYERERRDKRLVFVTRERLQAFVDSFGFA